MRITLPPRLFAGLLLGLAVLAAPGARLAARTDSAAGDLQARDAWVRWLPAGLPAAGYLTLVNSSGADRFLLAASSPDYTAVELHESYTAPNGDMGMRRVDRVRIPAGGSVRLAPGGYHLMLMKARHPIAPGDVVTIELKFDDDRSLRVSLPVKPAGHQE
jgi:periplasmic copper chaperone A